ncbi:hypothetical protein JTY60_02165 [symbiont of Argiope bruennichi]|uniref:hypothetical protein n=1 Tax=symbiont of Argiope bruennichi TaxID=2810479 RepID=UPI003DA2CAB5
MKKSKKFFVSALFSVLGTIGIAGCDMGGNNPTGQNGNGSQATFNTAVHSSNFLRELRGDNTTGGKAFEATLEYFSLTSGKKPFIAPKEYDRTNVNWESVSINGATYLKDLDGYMVGLVSVSVSGVFDNAGVVYYLYTVQVADDGAIIQCKINSDVSDGVWNFMSDRSSIARYNDFGAKITDLTHRVIGITPNDNGKLNVGETSKEAQKAGFAAIWVMNAKITVNADDDKIINIVVSDGQIDSVQ